MKKYKEKFLRFVLLVIIVAGVSAAEIFRRNHYHYTKSLYNIKQKKLRSIRMILKFN